MLILIFVSFYGLFSRYVGYTGVWNDVITIIILLLVWTKGNNWLNKVIKNIFILGSFFMSVIFLSLSVFFSSSNAYIIDNLQAILYPLLICILVWDMNQSKAITEFFTISFGFFNLMWILNLFVLSRQVTGSGFMIKSEWLALNNFYPDQCCGLFGNSGTHPLGMFSVFILIYNLYYANYKAKKKKLLLAYTFLTEGLMLIYSRLNENMALFVLLPFFGALYLLLETEWKSQKISKKIIKYGRYIILFLFLAFVIFQFHGIGDYIRNELSTRINKIISFKVFETNGSNERLAIPFYALANDLGWRFGRGFGSWQIHLSGFLGFRHFGLNSAGSFIALGGIWFYISYCSLYASLMKEMCYCYVQNRKLWFVCMAVIVALSLYTVIFTSAVSIIWIAFVFSIFGEMKKEIEKERK